MTGGPTNDLEHVLRRSLQQSDPNVDYAALLDRVERRVTTHRRRRAVGTVAGAFAAAGIIAGGVVIINDQLLQPLESASAPSAIGEAPSAQEPAEDGTPWQNTTPPEASDEVLISEGEWEIPDARPSGIAELDALGAPDSTIIDPAVSPLPLILTCSPADTAAGEVAVTGVNYNYTAESDAGLDVDMVRISVTGWEDGSPGTDRLRDPGFHCAWPGSGPEEVTWPGAGDGLLTAPVEGFGSGETVGAVISQGDYLVGVTVRGTDATAAAELAVEIATKTAQNLEELDSERAGS